MSWLSLKPRHPYEVADRECETRTGALDAQGNSFPPPSRDPLSPEQLQTARANALLGLEEFMRDLDKHKTDPTTVLNKVPLELQVMRLRNEVLTLSSQVEGLKHALQEFGQSLEAHKRDFIHHTHG